jgi:hypothetical protein
VCIHFFVTRFEFVTANFIEWFYHVEIGGV